MDKEEAKKLLPKEGDLMTRVPRMQKMQGMPDPEPRLCVVVEVNEEHLWYRVLFDNGVSECYKVPEIDKPNRSGWDKR